MNELLQKIKSLNEGQKEAVEDIYGTSIVIAGPGSGKTFVITIRTANMINNGILAENILLATFTKKAANEIKQRVVDIVGKEAAKITVGTYHSICNRILRKYSEYVGLDKNFTVIDVEDSKKIFKDILKSNGYKYDENLIMSTISRYKCNLISPSTALKNANNNENNLIIAKVYQIYENFLEKNNLIDFDNLIYKTVRLMQRYPNVKEEINNKYKYVTADEFHDSSFSDVQLIKMLAGEDENVCFVLDEEQSIYSFRGSKIDAVLNTPNLYKNPKTHLLSVNYRSTQTIVNASRSLISNNPKFIEKNLYSNNEVGNPIITFEEKSAEAEAKRIVKLIKLSVDKYGFEYNDIAILYRANYTSKIIEEYLLKTNIPYKITGSVNFYNRKEVKDIMSYLIFATNLNNNLAFERAIKIPKRGIGDVAIKNIENYSKENSLDLLTGLKNIQLKNKSKLEDFISIVDSIIESIEYKKTHEIIEQIISDIDYCEYLRNESKSDEEFENKIENIQKLIEVCSFFDSMEDFIYNINLESEVALESNENNGVNLLTMHSSKGLEWPVVIIASAIEGSTPFYKATTVSEIEEERRLFYVACTRAEKLLFITFPKYLKQRGNIIKAQESRFLKEIHEDYLYKYSE